MSWVGDLAAEIDRLVVAVHGRAGAEFAASELAATLNAHPGLINGLGTSLLQGPVPVESIEVIYPYSPPHVRDTLIENNLDGGLITIADGHLHVTEAGREPTRLASVLLDDSADALWHGADLGAVEQTSRALVEVGRKLPLPMQPSAFAVTEVLVDRPTQGGRVFRLLSALRYWRADAHRAAWSAAGLSVQEAHALNRLWDLDRGAVRVGQGDERPGRTGVAALTEKGFAAGESITDAGRVARAAIEADTDVRTEPIYEHLADREAFLDSLRKLPTD
jgi:helix-turn-helix protein